MARRGNYGAEKRQKELKKKKKQQAKLEKKLLKKQGNAPQDETVEGAEAQPVDVEEGAEVDGAKAEDGDTT